MRHFKVLGTKNGVLDKQTLAVFLFVDFPVLVVFGPIAAVAVGFFIFLIAHFTKKNFDGRDDWVSILYRLLFKRQGTYTLIEKDVMPQRKKES